MKKMSMLELSRDARSALEALRSGERLLLTYQGEVVARLEPVQPDAAIVPDNDPILTYGV